MKSFLVLVASASVAVGQLSSLPSCGQVCMTNMNEIAVNQFNCTQGDVLCYCEKINYGYGVRDCANEACSSASDAAAVIAYGTNYCGSAVSKASPPNPSAPGYSVLTSAVATFSGVVSALPTSNATGIMTGTGGAVVPTPISTVIGTSIFTSGSKVLTSVEPLSTIFSTPVASSLRSVVSSIKSEASGAASSALASGSEAASSVAASATGSANVTGAAPIATAAPLLGAGAMALLMAVL